MSDADNDRELLRIGLISIILVVFALIAAVLMEPQHEAPHPVPLGQSVGGGRIK